MNNLIDDNNEKGYYDSPLKYQLPSQFFEKICDLENSLLVEKDLIKIENLARLYKIGVEFYSGHNSTKESDYLFRLQGLFSNKQINKFYDDVENKKERNLSHLNSSNKKKPSFNMEINLMKYDNKESVSNILSKFEFKFNSGLTKINNDIIKQQSSIFDNIKKKKTQMKLLEEVV